MKKFLLTFLLALTAVGGLTAQTVGIGVFSRLYLGGTGASHVELRWGSGDPSGVVSAPAGSLYQRTDGTVFIGTGGTVWTQLASGGTAAPIDAQYWVGAANGTLTAEKNLGLISTALVINTAGVPSAFGGSSCGGGQFASSVSALGVLTCSTPSGSGDFSSNTSSSVDSEIVLFSGTLGKTGKRATGTGVVHATSGVYSVSTVTNAELAGSIAATKLVGTDIDTLGTVTTGTWSATAIAFGKGGTGLTTAADDTTLISSGSAWVATAVPNCTDTGGNHLNYATATNAFSCGTSGSGGGGTALSAITAAAAANTIASGNNHSQIWNWALTSNSVAAFTIGETTAATSGTADNQALLVVNTLASSTAIPLYVKNYGATNSFRVDDVSGDTTPFVITSAGLFVIGGTSSGTGAAIDIQSSPSNILCGTGTATVCMTSTSSPYVGTTSTHPMSIRANGTDYVTVGTTGIVDFAGKDGTTAPTQAGVYMGFGGSNNTINRYYGMGFGRHLANTNVPAFFGFQMIDDNSFTYGDLTFWTRSVNTDTAPTERFRITNNGLIKLIGSPLVSTGTVPTLSGGCSTGTQTGGAYAGTFTSSTTGTCAVTITFAATAPTGYVCNAVDVTTAVDALFIQTGGSATTATFSSTTVSGDVIRFACIAY